MGFAHSPSVEFTAYAFLSIHPILAIKIEQKVRISADRTSPVSIVSFCIYKQSSRQTSSNNFNNVLQYNYFSVYMVD